MTTWRSGLFLFFCSALLLIPDGSALAQTIEFDVRATTRHGERPAHNLDGYILARVQLREVTADGTTLAAFYSEEIGYVHVSGGVARIVLGATNPAALTAALNLNGHPDENRLGENLRIELERCTRVRPSGGQPRIDTCEEGAWQHWSSEDLRSAPLAMTVASVPLRALPPEVVLHEELEAAVSSLRAEFTAAIDAERRAREAAIAAIATSIDAERARALAAEAQLRGDLAAEATARANADAAEAAARAANDAALAAEVAAVMADARAQIAQLSDRLDAEMRVRSFDDASTLASAKSFAAGEVNNLRTDLATPGGGALAWANITGKPSATVRLVTVQERASGGGDLDDCLVTAFCPPNSREIRATCPLGTSLLSCSGDIYEKVTTASPFDENGRTGCHAIYDHRGPGRFGHLVAVTAVCGRIE